LQNQHYQPFTTKAFIRIEAFATEVASILEQPLSLLLNLKIFEAEMSLVHMQIPQTLTACI
jgi:hypothetical protein